MLTQAHKRKGQTKWVDAIWKLFRGCLVLFVLVSCTPAIPADSSPIFIFTGGPGEQATTVISEDNVDDLKALGYCGRGGLADLVFSPNGELVAAATSEGLFIQNLKDLGERVFVKADQPMVALTFSPDGTTLASSSLWNDIYLWRVSDFTLLKILERPENSSGDLDSLAFSPDGRIIVSGSSEGMIQLWNISKNSLELTTEVDTDWSVQSMAFSPDGKILAVVSSPFLASHGPYKIHLWSGNGDTLIHVITMEDVVNQLAFLPDGAQFVTASWAYESGKYLIQQWSSVDGSPLQTLEADGRSSIGQIALAPGHSIVSVLQPGEPEGTRIEFLYRYEGGLKPSAQELIDTYPYIFPDAKMLFSADGTRLAVFNSRGFQIWEVAANRLLLMQTGFLGSQWGVDSISFSPDGRLLAATYSGGQQIWRVSDCDLTGGHGSDEMKFSPDGAELISSTGESIYFMDPSDGSVLRSIKEDTISAGDGPRIGDVAVTADGTLLAVPVGNRIMLRGASDGGLITVIDVLKSVGAAAFSPDDEMLAVGNDSYISLYNIPEGTLRQEIRAGSGGLSELEFSPDGTMLASRADEVRVWRVLDGSMIYELEDAGHIAFSPDGSILATTTKADPFKPSSNREFQLSFWRASDGHSLGTLKSNSGVTSLAFSPDGTLFATGSEHGTILFWGITP